ncbi:MAG: MG2 domain-containing protein, partial [Bacteroidota bacterium]|nr:MG2 domain-containing protein [Bacteroidota bacterium]
MKVPSWKKIAVAAVAVAAAIAGVFYFTPSTGKKKQSFFVNPAFAEYINSYTTGVIPSASVLNIVFTRDMVDSSRVGEQADTKLFEFDPSVKGAATWLDRRTLQFRPEKRMASGQMYNSRFFLSRLIDDLPGELQTFEYSFQIIPQNYEVAIVNVKPVNKTELSREVIEGRVNTADFAEGSAVEKLVSAFQDSQPLKITWTHAADGKAHQFVVQDVTRKSEGGKVDLSVNGIPIGVDRKEEIPVEIPALGQFALMNIRVVQSPNQYVVLQFSDPIKENQNLKGLITMSDLPDLDFDIHNNEIWVYPPVTQNGTRTISIASGIRNVLDVKLKNARTEEVHFEQLKPEVRFTGKGSILPSTQGLVVPFEAVSLRAVDVQIIKIFEDNVLQFLQVNNFEGRDELRRVGRRILSKTIPLESTGVTHQGKWNRYTLDISRLIQTEPGAIYEIRLSFRKSYSTFPCATPEGAVADPLEFEAEEDFEDGYAGEYNFGYYDNYYDEYYYGEDYDWDQRDNPCNSSYYTSNRAVSRNVLASDLGLTVKRGEDGNTMAFVTDLKSATPVSGVDVSLYNFQLQQIASAKTDGDGKISVNTRDVLFALVARNGSQRGYLRLANGEALLVSNFDVSGEVVQKGLKGFLFGERGVWRPGDSLFLTFILEDKRDLLPDNHPVVFELANPQGQVINRIVRSSAENGFYKFATATSADAPTGNWLGRAKVGGTVFSQTLKIETVKPNRLKINLDFGTEKLTSPDISGVLNVKWLHGAPGRNLKAEYEVMLSRQETTFKSFPGFNFDDPSREFFSESQLIFEGTTDAEGNANVNTTIEHSGSSPSGLLNAVFRGKVFEEGGNFSIDRFSIPYYPYKSFVGLRVPEGEKYSGILYTDQDHTIDIATVDADGKAVSRQGVDVNLYKLDWRWWWDNSNERLANFMESSYTQLMRSGNINTSNGKGEWKFNLQAAEYGRYFLRVCDPVSGHCAGQIIYVDEPGWYSRARATDARGGANLLSFSTDKTEYNIGEKIQLTIPGIANGRALVSIENGSKVLQTHWVQTRQGDTKFSIDATAAMAPNVYIHVSLMQPHDQTVNDMPMRLYGVTSIQVEDPATHLQPIIEMADKLVPGEPVSIRVSEKNNRKMTFTLAVVDEGLLDLTRFKTPDAWRSFYAKEALGVRTWDLFDYVMGAFGANLERFITIGGDDAISPNEVDPLVNRFQPVVKYFGPYTLECGSREIRFTMPQYVGSVKAMVVAGYEGAYGKAEKVSTVKKPLMVLATLPRVLGTGELVTLPITLFTGETNQENVRIDVNAKGPVATVGERSQTVSLGPNSDMTIDFELQVKAETGAASIEVTATSGNLKASDIIEIQVRNPNLPVTRVEEYVLEENKSLTASLTPFGMTGTNSAVLEISSLPPINLGSRMRYLLQYPHGCVEQTTSAVFPQLYLDQVKALTDAERDAIQRNVKAGIERLRSFAQSNGGFAYWPGVSESTDSWGTSYAGHFLVEAQAKGHYVPADVLDRWKTFQRNMANAWRKNDGYYNSDLLQAYRLYTLAVAGAPEAGAMNRMREEGNLVPAAAWMLASAYAISGQTEAAQKLIAALPLAVKPYREMGYTYGSHVRDQAFILEALVLLGDRVRAFEVVKE